MVSCRPADVAGMSAPAGPVYPAPAGLVRRAWSSAEYGYSGRVVEPTLDRVAHQFGSVVRLQLLQRLLHVSRTSPGSRPLRRLRVQHVLLLAAGREHQHPVRTAGRRRGRGSHRRRTGRAVAGRAQRRPVARGGAVPVRRCVVADQDQRVRQRGQPEHGQGTPERRLEARVSTGIHATIVRSGTVSAATRARCATRSQGGTVPVSR
jgi:hypothetical protein